MASRHTLLLAARRTQPSVHPRIIVRGAVDVSRTPKGSSLRLGDRVGGEELTRDRDAEEGSGFENPPRSEITRRTSRPHGAGSEAGWGGSKTAGCLSRWRAPTRGLAADLADRRERKQGRYKSN